MALTLTIVEENGLTVTDDRVVITVGTSGPQGATGAAGVGVPAGGTTGQVLAKASGTSYDTTWVTGGGGSGDVVGPASSVDGRAVLFDGTTGKLVKQATAAPVLEGDARLTDARTPSPHAASHQDGGTDELALDGSQVTSGTLDIARLPTGTTSSTVAAGNDARFTDARTPTAHKSTHSTGGTDALAPSDIGAAAAVHVHSGADITSGTVGTARLGTGTASSSTFLRGDGSWQTPPGGTVDVVSNVASGRILGRTSSGSGDSEELTDANVRTFLGLATVATSGSASDLSTGTLAAARGGPVLTGPSLISTVRQYSLPGVFYTATNNATAFAADTIYYIPFVCLHSVTVDRIAFDVTTAVASSNARVGVYQADVDWQPTGAPVIDGTATTATTGAKEITVSATLTAGRHLACIVSDSAISVRAAIANSPWVNDINASTFGGGQNIVRTLRRVALTYPATLPTTGPAWTTTSDTTGAAAPLILLRYTT